MRKRSFKAEVKVEGFAPRPGAPTPEPENVVSLATAPSAASRAQEQSRKPLRPEQAHLPGMEPKRIVAIEHLAVEHQEAKDEAKAAKELMEKLESRLATLLDENEIPAYNLNGVIVVREERSKVKVTIKNRAKAAQE